VAGAKGAGGKLRVDSTEAPAIILWMDTAPARVEVEVVEAVPKLELQVSNRWRTSDGREDEWLNNYGMVIEADAGDGDSYLLRCSDGLGDLNRAFDDLVVRISRSGS
jgi:hypothetical protein